MLDKVLYRTDKKIVLVNIFDNLVEECVDAIFDFLKNILCEDNFAYGSCYEI